jgi:hypothetical protein
MSLSCLPDEVLKLVMQHVPLKDRLTSCCLVNRRLHAAAVAATDTVDLQGEDRSELLAWLPQYGHHVTMLKLLMFDEAVLQLPCPNLQELKLHFCSVQLGPTADGQPGVVQSCTKLTRLDLWCHIMDDPMLDSLSQLVHLQYLHILPRRPGPLVNGAGHESCTIEGLSAATLPCLQQLTFLGVNNLAVENLAQLSALTGLQFLTFGVSGGITIGPNTGLALPPSLGVLEVQSAVEIGVLPLLPTELRGLLLGCVVQGPTGGPDLFFSGVLRLPHLAKIRLTCSEEFVWPAAAPAYSALTANNSLFSLDVGGNLPQGSLSYLFPAECRLSHLTYLRFGNAMDLDDDDLIAPPPIWSAADLSRLVSCCPNLRSFIDVSMQHGGHASVLSELQDLRTLHVQYGDDEGDGVGDGAEGATYKESIKGLAALTQLSCLHYKSGGVELDESLLPFTALKALTALQIIDSNKGERDFCLDEVSQPVDQQGLW